MKRQPFVRYTLIRQADGSVFDVQLDDRMICDICDESTDEPNYDPNGIVRCPECWNKRNDKTVWDC